MAVPPPSLHLLVHHLPKHSVPDKLSFLLSHSFTTTMATLNAPHSPLPLLLSMHQLCLLLTLKHISLGCFTHGQECMKAAILLPLWVYILTAWFFLWNINIVWLVFHWIWFPSSFATSHVQTSISNIPLPYALPIVFHFIWNRSFFPTPVSQYFSWSKTTSLTSKRINRRLMKKLTNRRPAS